jgi:hypothetical protein
MTRKMMITIVLVVAMFSSIPALQTLAAPSTSSLGTGTVQSIIIETNPTTKVTTVLVTLVDAAGLAQTVRISLETAITMQLVIPNAEMIGKNILIADPIDPTKNVTGIVKSLAFVTDPVTKVTTLTVTLTDALNVDQVVSLDMEQAQLLNLIAPNAAKINTHVVIDPTLILNSTAGSNFWSTSCLPKSRLRIWRDFAGALDRDRLERQCRTAGSNSKRQENRRFQHRRPPQWLKSNQLGTTSQNDIDRSAPEPGKYHVRQGDSLTHSASNPNCHRHTLCRTTKERER